MKKWNKHGNRAGEYGKLDAVGTLLSAPFFAASSLACVPELALAPRLRVLTSAISIPPAQTLRHTRRAAGCLAGASISAQRD